MSDLVLVIVEDAHKAALQRGAAALASLLGVAVPEGWPQFPEAFTGPALTGGADWPSYLIVSGAAQSLVGSGGYYGAPDDAGVVEIGYEIAPAFWNRGLATAFARRLIDRAFADSAVIAVVAHTLAEENASNAVLRKVGMTFLREEADAEVGAVWLWRIARP